MTGTKSLGMVIGLFVAILPGFVGRTSTAASGQRPQPYPVSALGAVLAAETEGAAYPKPQETAPRNTLRSAPGTSERRCVRAGTNHDVRSGEFVAGPFDYYSALWQQNVAKMYWVPLVAPPADQRNFTAPESWRLNVKAIHLDTDDSPRLVVSATGLGRAISGDQNFFFPAGPMLPSPGRWLLIATSGPNWGCFILEFSGTELVDEKLLNHLWTIK